MGVGWGITAWGRARTAACVIVCMWSGQKASHNLFSPILTIFPLFPQYITQQTHTHTHTHKHTHTHTHSKWIRDCKCV